MKRTNCYFVILIIVFGSCASVKENYSVMHAKNDKYKDLSSFNNDTLEYVKTNFYVNQKFYVGKPMSLIFKDLEAGIVSYTPTSLFNPMDKSDGVYLTISHTEYQEDSNKTLVETSTAVDLIVEFTEFYSYMDAIKIRDKNGNTWGKAQEDFYKNFIVKEIFIYIPKPK